MRKLIINGIVADLAGVQIALTKESNDLFDFKNKRSNLSNTIKLPKSQANNLIFQSATDIASASIVRDFMEVVYIQDYEEIISRGRGKLVSVTDTFNFIIYWGNVSIIDIFGTKTLRDLDLSDLNHTFDLASILFYANINSDLIYPVMNTFRETPLAVGSGGTPIDASVLIPAVSLRRILEQMQADNNVVFQGIENYFSDMSDEFIPVSQRKDLTFDLTITNNNLRAISVSGFEFNQEKEEIHDINFVLDPDNPANVVNEHTIDEAGEFGISASFEFIERWQKIIQFGFGQFGTDYQANYNYTFILYAEFYDSETEVWDDYVDAAALTTAINNGTLVYQRTAGTINRTGPAWKDRWDDERIEAIWKEAYVNISVNGDVREYKSGDKIRWKFYKKIKNLLPEGSGMRMWHQEGSVFQVGFQQLKLGWLFKVAENMPEISQIDLLKYIAARTGSLVDIEDGTNVIRFRSIRDFINSVNQAQDISDMIQDWNINNLHSKLGQDNLLYYDNNDDVALETGQGNFQINDNTLHPVKDFYKAPFSATVNQKWEHASGNIYEIAHLPLFEEWTDSMDDIKARILKAYIINQEINYTDGTTTVSRTERPACYYNNLSQGFERALNSYYQDYIEASRNYKQITANVYITSSQFKDIDLMLPVYARQLSGYLLLNKIENFVDNRLTKFVMTLLSSFVPSEIVIPPLPDPPDPEPDITDALLLEEVVWFKEPILHEDGEYIKLE